MPRTGNCARRSWRNLACKPCRSSSTAAATAPADGGRSILRTPRKTSASRLSSFSASAPRPSPTPSAKWRAFAAGTKCKNYFYQANINPRADERLTPAQWREAVDRLEKISASPASRALWSSTRRKAARTGMSCGRASTPSACAAIPDSLTAAIHERTSRELEISFDLERGQSILVPDRETERPDRRPKKHETFRADERHRPADGQGGRPAALAAAPTTGRASRRRWKRRGDYMLARGDRRDFVVIDRAGRRPQPGAAAWRESGRSARAHGRPRSGQPAERRRRRRRSSAPRQVEREQPRRPDRGRYDNLRATERDVQREQFKGRYDDLRAAEPPPEVAREFASSANRAAEPAAPTYDRDRDNAAWEAKLAEAAINAAAQKAASGPSRTPAGKRAGQGRGRRRRPQPARAGGYAPARQDRRRHPHGMDA